MKYVKALCLTTIAVAGLMALVGSSMASATVLCKNNANTSTCSEPYPVGTEFKTSLSGLATLHTGFKSVSCGKASGEGKLESAGSSTTTPGGKGTGTYGECNCSVSVLSTGTIEVHHIAGTDNGTITFNGSTVTTACSSIFGTVHCNYVTENTDLGTLTGGNPAVATFKASIPRESTSPLCEEEAVLTATFTVTAPAPLYVAAG